MLVSFGKKEDIFLALPEITDFCKNIGTILAKCKSDIINFRNII